MLGRADIKQMWNQRDEAQADSGNDGTSIDKAVVAVPARLRSSPSRRVLQISAVNDDPAGA